MSARRVCKMARRQQPTLGQAVRWELRGSHQASPQHCRRTAAPQRDNAFLRSRAPQAVKEPRIPPPRPLGPMAVGLHAHQDDVAGVGDERRHATDATGDHDLLEQVHVRTLVAGDVVGAVAKSREHRLAAKRGTEPIIKAAAAEMRHALGPRDRAQRSEDIGQASRHLGPRELALQLAAHLDHVQWVAEDTCRHLAQASGHVHEPIWITAARGR
mmetsp:Transcript_7699/g.19580  ORF Transcript_7699/g.19580 Transcript_7699/m.19580 type:complete len:214 (-) Transcript_7699:88-729(-)